MAATATVSVCPASLAPGDGQDFFFPSLRSVTHVSGPDRFCLAPRTDLRFRRWVNAPVFPKPFVQYAGKRAVTHEVNSNAGTVQAAFDWACLTPCAKCAPKSLWQVLASLVIRRQPFLTSPRRRAVLSRFCAYWFASLEYRRRTRLICAKILPAARVEPELMQDSRNPRLGMFDSGKTRACQFAKKLRL